MWFIGKCDITTCSAGKILKHTHTHTHTVGTPTQICGGETSDDNKVMWAASTMIQWSIVTHSLSLSPILLQLSLSLSIRPSVLYTKAHCQLHKDIGMGYATSCFLHCTDLPSPNPSSF